MGKCRLKKKEKKGGNQWFQKTATNVNEKKKLKKKNY